MGLIVVLFAAFGLPAQIGEVEAGDWSSYLANNSGSGFNQADSGKTLFNYADTNKFSYFYGASCISHGVLYIGNFDGTLYAFGT